MLSGARLSLLFGFVGGYCDAASYILSGAFTGHVTGNIVLSAISFVFGHSHAGFLQVLAVVCFLAGTAAALFFEFEPEPPKPASSFRLDLTFEAVLITLAAVILWLRLPADQSVSLACLALALGVQNGTVRKIKGVSVHTTFMTGPLTTILQAGVKDVAKLSSSAQRLRSITRDRELKTLVALALFFAAGAVTGALATKKLQAAALLIPLAIVVIIAAFANAPRVEHISPRQ